MQSSQSKRRKLNYDKCVFCRKDKKRCEPQDRQWPNQKCHRCEKMDLECSGNTKAVKVSEQIEEPSQKHTEGMGSASNDETNELKLLNFLSVKALWLSRMQRLCAQVEASELSYARRLGEAGNMPDLSQQRDWIAERRMHICETAKKALDSPSLSTLVKYGLATIMDSIVSNCYLESDRGPKELGYFLGDKEIHAQTVRSLQHSHIASAMSLQERLLNCLPENTSPETWEEEFQRFCDLYRQFRSMLVSEVTADDDQLPTPPNECLPYMEDLSGLLAAIKYFPHPNAKDIFGRTLLHLELLEDYIDDDTHVVIQKLSTSDLNSKDYFGRTALHIAATMGDEIIVENLLNAGVDINSQEYSAKLTPLQCAAAAGHVGVAELILEASSANSSPQKAAEVITQIQRALGLATANGHLGIIELLQPQPRVTTDETRKKTKVVVAEVPGMNIVRDGSGYDSIAKLAVDWAGAIPDEPEELV